MELLKQFAEDIKMEIYYNFDELIPSACADVIDKVLERYLKNDFERRTEASYRNNKPEI